MKASSRFLGLVLPAIGALVAWAALAARPEPATSIPIFAHQYEVTCDKCHSVIPHLNEFGAAFMASGYRIPGVQARPGLSDFGKSQFARLEREPGQRAGRCGFAQGDRRRDRDLHGGRYRYALELPRRAIFGRWRHARLDPRRLGHRSAQSVGCEDSRLRASGFVHADVARRSRDVPRLVSRLHRVHAERGRESVQRSSTRRSARASASAIRCGA